MKDYYNILGIEKTASEKEIKDAHRKLAKQFHPDMNHGDKRFSGRFIEVQKAYQVLSDPEKRKDYDYNTNYWKSYKASHTLPFVDYFAIDKSIVFAGDELTFTWRTSNADKVTLKPFGIVPPNGQKTFIVKYSMNPSLTFQIIAEDTKTGHRNEAVLIIIYSGYRRVNEGLSFLVTMIVIIILYFLTQIFG